MSRVIHQLIVWCFKEKRKSQQFCKWVFPSVDKIELFQPLQQTPFLSHGSAGNCT